MQKENKKENELMEKIVSLCKRRGFIFQGSEIYGGMAGFYDYGPLGTLLKRNIEKSWIKQFVEFKENVYLIDTPILMHPRVWEASGHTAEFADPLVECKKCKNKFRADQLDSDKCPNDGETLGAISKFNLMLETKVGASEDTSIKTYLRPEEAQNIFIDFKNIVDSFSPKLPFGVAQIGKAFRNEITPRDFIYRLREFQIMEMEYFIHPDIAWEPIFDSFLAEQKDWLGSIGVDIEKLHPMEHPESGRAHYSKKTVDLEFEYPFGIKELTGLAHRGDFDLKKHEEFSGEKMGIMDEEKGERVVPHVIEPTISVDRAILALMVSAYREEIIGEDTRVYLKFPPHIAPYKACVSPLLKNKPELQTKAREVFSILKKEFGWITYDDNGNIGKRYRRQDEIGTPWCIVVDFDTLTDDTVTVRDRDTGTQERVKVIDLVSYIKEKLN
ncbi:MAG: glycine--tRNA ligase [Candidatus Nomurabacteria bacterium]|nr:glycine--tRNA ligase [Candidatus Nomurabacteria bacterium]